jgi:hypothetical protein
MQTSETSVGLFLLDQPSGIFFERNDQGENDGTAVVIVSCNAYKQYVVRRKYKYRQSVTEKEIAEELKGIYDHMLAVISCLSEILQIASQQKITHRFDEEATLEIQMKEVTENRLTWQYQFSEAGGKQTSSQEVSISIPAEILIMDYLGLEGLSFAGQDSIVSQTAGMDSDRKKKVNEAALAYVGSLPPYENPRNTFTYPPLPTFPWLIGH